MRLSGILPALILMLAYSFGTSSIAAESQWVAASKQQSQGIQVASRVKKSEQDAEVEEMRATSSSKHVRRFHEVLDELLAEFGYDVKTGQIKGLKNLSVRKVRVSSALPRTYEEYVELMVAERIRENSNIRLISCVPCKTKSTTLVEGKLLISSPATNMAKLETAAAQLGIENFMDVVLVYHTTHMVLAFNVFDSKTKDLVWARTYNSETIKSRYQKLAIDYSQVEKSRPGEDYVPEYRMLIGLGGAGIPNVGGTSKDSWMLNMQFRATEKFDNRHSEFGLLFSVFKSTSSLAKDYPAYTPDDDTSSEEEDDEVEEVTPKPFEQAIALYGMYGHNLLGSVESYNRVRHGFNVGVGILMAQAYLAPIGRVGWDIYFGRRFSTNFGVNYIGPAEILLEGESVATKGGVGGDAVLSFNY